MVPLFLNNACPEGSLDILYHKPARRYKMGDEIRTAVSSRFAMFRRILGVPPEGRQLKHSTPVTLPVLLLIYAEMNSVWLYLIGSSLRRESQKDCEASALSELCFMMFLFRNEVHLHLFSE